MATGEGAYKEQTSGWGGLKKELPGVVGLLKNGSY